jgi:type VI secretion system secreted protein VgrG
LKLKETKPMALSQNDRLIRIATPLEDNTFVVTSFTGTEELSELFDFELEMASEHGNITFDQMAGKNVTVGIKSSDGSERCFNGMIVEFSAAEVSEIDGYSTYSAVMQPAVRVLTQCFDCRIFQDNSVPDIIKQVLDRESLAPKEVKVKIDYRLDLAGSYSPRDYCVQYNESDFSFITRLCENEGIFYFFEHENGKHTLVFADSPDRPRPYLNGKKQTVKLQKTTGANLESEVINALREHKRLTTAQYTARDYNFTIPNSDMTVTEATVFNTPGGQGEKYEYPGGYEKISTRGAALARIRMQAEDVRLHTLHGSSNCRGFIPGFKFTLAEHPVKPLNGQDYIFTKVHHQACQHFTTGTSNSDSYSNNFSCIPHSVPFRPETDTPKPVISGSQSAIVTGPEGEEIHTDEHGRVKVRFHWDRRPEQARNGNTSCWIRVSQSWAGGKWGAMHIPRVGQEVIVNFMDGDPDRPMITGRVYHGQNKPPYDLPAEKTKSTIMSNSSKDGRGNFNEIRFEDLKDAEEIFTHAAKDQNQVVENNMSTRIKNDQSIEVQNNRTLTVASGNEAHTIQSGGRQVSVKSDEKHLNAANFLQKVGADFTLKVNGNITLDASGNVKITGAKVFIN